MSTIRSEALALSIINDGSGYVGRCAAATLPQHWRASKFTEIALRGSIIFAKEEHDATPFSTSDVLLAAAEVADYYEKHVAELEKDAG